MDQIINGMMAFGLTLIAGCGLFLMLVLFNSHGAKEFREKGRNHE